MHYVNCSHLSLWICSSSQHISHLLEVSRHSLDSMALIYLSSQSVDPRLHFTAWAQQSSFYFFSESSIFNSEYVLMLFWVKHELIGVETCLFDVICNKSFSTSIFCPTDCSLLTFFWLWFLFNFRDTFLYFY